MAKRRPQYEILISRLQDENISRAEADACWEKLYKWFDRMLRGVWGSGVVGIDFKDFKQEVFIRLIDNLSGLRAPGALPGYLKTIAIRLKLDYLEKKNLIDPEEKIDAIESVDTRLENVLPVDVLSVVRLHLEELPPRQKEVLELYLIKGYSTAVIAERLQRSEGHIRKTKSLGRKKLIARMEQLGETLDKAYVEYLTRTKK